MQDSALNLLKKEFDLWGVKMRHHDLNSGHIKLEWRVSPDKEPRHYIIPKTAGDRRGWLNARSKIRQLFRADGLSLKEEINKPKPALHKALAITPVVEKDSDQIKLLRAEVGDLSEMIMELAHVIEKITGALPALLAPPAPAPVIETVAILPPPKKSVRSVKAIDVVSEGWNSTEALARDMELAENIAYRKLYYLMQQGKVEHSGGRWRKTPEKIVAPVVAAAAARGKKRLNGALNGKHH